MLTVKQAAVRESIVAIIGNVLFGSVGTYLALPKGQDTLNLIGGPESAGFGFLPASILFPGTVIFLVTHLIKKRILQNKMTPGNHAFFQKMPKNIFIALLMIVGTCLFILAPLCIGLVWLVFGNQMTYTTAFAVNVGYLVLLAILCIPVIVYRAANLHLPKS